MTLKKRESSLELLRIFAILLIIIHHYACHSTLINVSNVNYQLLVWGGKIGVILFLLITGYFQINSNFKIKKILRIILATIFYSITFFILFAIFDKNINLSLDSIKYFIPILSKQYWFITNYVVIYFLSPFINKIIKNMNKDTLKHLLIIFTLYFFVFKTLIIGNNIENSETILGFIYFYSLGSYIKLYGINFFEKLNNKNILLSISIILSIILLNIFNINILGNIKNPNIIIAIIKRFIGLTCNYSISSIFILISSISCFYHFKNLNIKYNKTINFISVTTLGCYLIHDNNLVRPFLWNKIFNINEFITYNLNNLFVSSKMIINKIISIPSIFLADTFNISSKYFIIIHCLLAISIVFISCIIIEHLRKKLFEEPIFKAIDKSKKINNILDKTDNFMNY